MIDNPKIFYDTIADDYDSFTEFDNRFLKEEPFYKYIVAKYKLGNVLDYGCGSGFHSILFAKLGLDVSAYDISEKMILKTILNSQKYNICLRKTSDSINDIINFNQKYDAVICLGNTAAHFLNAQEFINQIKLFYNLLNANGIIIIHLLNYQKILKDKNRILNIKEVNNNIFVRFYDFINDGIVFNILKLEKNKNSINHNLQSTKLQPWKYENVKEILESNNFFIRDVYGDIMHNDFDIEKSKDVFFIAQK